MSVRLHGLTMAELAEIGDAELLRARVNYALDSFLHDILGDAHDWYDDEQCHAMLDALVAPHPPGPEREAIQRTVDMILVVIDGGVADTRSDDELKHWIELFRPEKEVDENYMV
jgi:hypothetical protein